MSNCIRGRGFTSAYRSRAAARLPIRGVSTGDSTNWAGGDSNPYSPPALLRRLFDSWGLRSTIHNRAIGSTTVGDWAHSMLPAHLSEFSASPPHLYDLRTAVNNVVTPLVQVRDDARWGLDSLRGVWPRSVTAVNIATPNDFLSTASSGWFDDIEGLLEEVAEEYECSSINLRAYARKWWLPDAVDKVHPPDAVALIYAEAYADLLRISALEPSVFPVEGGVSLQSGWQPLYSGHPLPTIDRLGQLILAEGMICRSAAAVDGEVVLTLPEGWRPASPQTLPVAHAVGCGRMIVNTNGNVLGYGLCNAWTSLGGLWWLSA